MEGTFSMAKPAFRVGSNIERVAPYVPGKPVGELQRELGIRSLVRLASNENPFGPSAHALAAAAEALQHGHRYPDGHDLRSKLASLHGVSSDEIVLGNGSNEIIDIVCRTFAAPGTHAVYPDPSFVWYRMSTTVTAMHCTEVALREHVAYDASALIAAVRPDTRLFFLANPNNPTGAYLARSELARVLCALPPTTIAVVDEAYVEYADAPDYGSALALRELHENTLVLRTFSKAYGLAAFRVGYGIGPQSLVSYLDRVRAPFNVSSIGLAAASAALDDPAYLQRCVLHNAAERARVSRALCELGLSVAPSQGNFVLVNVGSDGRTFYERLLRKGVIVRPMPPPLTTHLRVTLGLCQENDRMLRAVRELLHQTS
jgi:histidinol-phosphate aminotransferase